MAEKMHEWTLAQTGRVLMRGSTFPFGPYLMYKKTFIFARKKLLNKNFTKEH